MPAEALDPAGQTSCCSCVCKTFFCVSKSSSSSLRAVSSLLSSACSASCSLDGALSSKRETQTCYTSNFCFGFVQTNSKNRTGLCIQFKLIMQKARKRVVQWVSCSVTEPNSEAFLCPSPRCAPLFPSKCTIAAKRAKLTSRAHPNRPLLCLLSLFDPARFQTELLKLDFQNSILRIHRQTNRLETWRSFSIPNLPKHYW